MKQELENYIDNWQKLEGIKPKNEAVFIEMFIEFLKSLDDSRDIEFDGDGSYFGWQVSIIENSVYWGKSKYGFEISYHNHHISVYRKNHQGFWTPEYINLHQGDAHFDTLRLELYVALQRLMGLTDLSKNI